MQKLIKLAKKTLEKGNLVIFPTETVYGLGGDATNSKAIKEIYKLKKRPSSNPLICHFPNLKKVKENFIINKIDSLLIRNFWPGPLTLILKKKTSSLISSGLSNNTDLVGCRIPDHKIAIDILKAVNFPIAAPSANIANKISSTQYDHLSNKLKKNTFVINGGSTILGLESTVIKTFNKKISILRLGSITIEEIKLILPKIKIEVNNNKSKVSPGNLLKHYSPNLPLRIKANKIKKNEVLLNFGKNNLKSNICEYNLSFSGNLKEASRNLFNYLHKLDKCKCSGIAVAPIPNNGLGKTINDRLIRASSK